jgi:hypothetical protein
MQSGKCPLAGSVQGKGDADMIQLLASENPAAINMPDKVFF